MFGGINLEDISAPRCFEVERRLREKLDIPVFHDDQHGTAIVVLAALLNALRVVGKELGDIRVVVAGVGAAGVAVTKILLQAGVRDVVGGDRQGAVHRDRVGLSGVKAEYASLTNPRGIRGSSDGALEGADVFIGVAGPGAVSVDGIRRMADRAIVFAMANPTPEVPPEEIEGIPEGDRHGPLGLSEPDQQRARFPGRVPWRTGRASAGDRRRNGVAAAHAIADAIAADELSADYIVPSVFNRAVAPAVAAAVAEAGGRIGRGTSSSKRRPRSGAPGPDGSASPARTAGRTREGPDQAECDQERP